MYNVYCTIYYSMCLAPVYSYYGYGDECRRTAPVFRVTLM